MQNLKRLVRKQYEKVIEDMFAYKHTKGTEEPRLLYNTLGCFKRHPLIINALYIKYKGYENELKDYLNKLGVIRTNYKEWLKNPYPGANLTYKGQVEEIIEEMFTKNHTK